jgi:RES domain-containing protein
VSADIAAVPIGGDWWRQVPHDRDPLARPDPPRDGRWQRGEVVDGLYLADSEETAWAEWYRWLAEHGLEPRLGLPRDLWRIEVSLERVADLRSTEALDRLGLTPPRPGAGWSAFQTAGEMLAGEGWHGLLAPSAARPEGRVLCVFDPTARSNALRTSGRPRRVDDPPAPPRGLRT